MLKALKLLNMEKRKLRNYANHHPWPEVTEEKIFRRRFLVSSVAKGMDHSRFSRRQTMVSILKICVRANGIWAFILSHFWTKQSLQLSFGSVFLSGKRDSVNNELPQDNWSKGCILWPLVVQRRLWRIHVWIWRKCPMERFHYSVVLKITGCSTLCWCDWSSHKLGRVTKLGVH